MSEVLSGWIDSTVASRIALTLVHFLWQGMLIAILAWLIGAMLRNKSANARYSIFLGGLLSMAVCAVVTFVVMEAYVQKDSAPSGSGSSIVATSPTSDNQHDSADMLDTDDSEATNLSVVQQSALPVIEDDLSASTLETDALASGESSDIQPGTSFSVWQKATPFIAAAYVFGVLILLGRLTLGLRGGWNLRRHSEPVDDASLLSLLARRAQALGMRVSPALCHCRDVAVPTVVGILRPTILLPMSLVVGLSPDQLEAILTHELAHIRRYDHLFNILQRVIEAVLFFHPAVWWVSRRIRIERENCCDDVVLQLGTEPVRYAELLVDLAEHDQQSRSARGVELVAVLQATAGRSQVSQRVRRLLGTPVSDTFRLSRGGLVLTLVCLALVVSGVVLLQGQTESNADTISGKEEADKSLANADLKLTTIRLSPYDRDLTVPGRGWFIVLNLGKRRVHGIFIKPTEYGLDASASVEQTAAACGDGDLYLQELGTIRTLRQTLIVPLTLPPAQDGDTVDELAIRVEQLSRSAIVDQIKAHVAKRDGAKSRGTAVTRGDTYAVVRSNGELLVMLVGDTDRGFIGQLPPRLQLTFCRVGTVDVKWIVDTEVGLEWSAPMSVRNGTGWRVRLRPVKTRWALDETPKLAVDLWNDSDQDFLYSDYQQTLFLHFDGSLYMRSYEVKPDLPPRRKLAARDKKDSAIQVSLVRSWRNNDPYADLRNRNSLARLKLTPGKHTVRISLMVGPVEEGDPVRLISKPIEIEIVGAKAAKGDKAEWGEAVNGVQARLRLKKRQWKAGETPRLLADVRNQGKTTYWIGAAQPVHEIEIDGKWHSWAGLITVLHGGFRPGSTQRDVPFTLVQNWKLKSGRLLAPDRTRPLNLAPGKHTVRVAFLLNPITKGAKNIRAESNPVEIEIVAAQGDAPKAAQGKLSPNTEENKPTTSLEVQFLDDKGKPVKRHAVALDEATIGFPKRRLRAEWADKDGLVRFDSVTAGQHRFVVNAGFPNAFLYEPQVPATGLKTQLKLKPLPEWSSDASRRPELDIKVKPIVKDGKELVEVTLTNDGAEPYTLSEYDLGFFYPNYFVYPPKSQQQIGLVLPPRRKESKKVTLNWSEYVRNGIWCVPREVRFRHPATALPENQMYVRIHVGNTGSIAFVVKKPESLVAANHNVDNGQTGTNKDGSATDASAATVKKRLTESERKLLGTWSGGAFEPTIITFHREGTFIATTGADLVEFGTWKLDGTKLIRTITKSPQEERVGTKLVRLLLNVDSSELRLGELRDGKRFWAYQRVKTDKADGKKTAANTAWGKAANGVQARLRTTKTTWRTDETPRFLADVRNTGKLALSVAPTQQLCEIEVDGKTYSWAGEVRIRSSDFSPGRTYSDIPVLLDQHWQSTKGEKLKWAVGKHKVRIVFLPRPYFLKVLGAPRWKPIRAVSNEIEIEVVPPPKERPPKKGSEKTGITVSGRVLTTMKPEGINVSLWHGGDGRTRTTNADRTGRYSFGNVPSSRHEYVLRVRGLDAGVWTEGVSILAGDKDIQAGDLYLNRSQSLSGTVRDMHGKPVAGAVINFSTSDAKGNRDAVKTDAKGQYRLYVIPRTVSLRCNGTRERYVPVGKPREEVDKNRLATVKRGTHVRNFDFRVKSAPKLFGTIHGQDGKLVPNANVIVEMNWSGGQLINPGDRDFAGIGTDQRLKTNKNGTFTAYLRRPVPRSWKEKISVRVIAWNLDRSAGGIARFTTGTESKTTGPVKVALTKTAGLTVKVTDEKGSNVAGATITVSNHRGAYPDVVEGSVKYLGNGRYRMTNLIPGLEYYLRAKKGKLDSGYGPRIKFTLKPGQEYDAGTVTLWSSPPKTSQRRPHEENKPNTKKPTAATDRPMRWGTLAGRIVLDGNPPERKKIEIPKESRRDNAGRTIGAADLLYHNLVFYDESLLVDKDGGIANVVIYATSPNMPAHPDTAKLSKRAATVSLLKGRFQHRITPIVVGQKLIVTNVDKTFHTLSMVNATNNEWFSVIVRDRFEYGFKKAEPVPVKLSSAIAPWPAAYLLPRKNPYVVVSAADGTFKFDKLPVGTWEFTVWHERASKPLHYYRIDIKEGDNSVNALKINPQALARPDPGEQVDDDKDDQAAWGKAVEGVQARLRTTKTTWRADETPRFLADVRNSGKLSLTVAQAQQLCEIEVDGKTYRWVGDLGLKSSAFQPGRVYSDIPVALDRKCRCTPPPGGGGRAHITLFELLTFSPGKHKIRIVFLPERTGFMGPGEPKPIRAVSNQIEITVVAAGKDAESKTAAKKAAVGEKAKTVQGLQVSILFAKQRFTTKEPITVTWKIKNVSDKPKTILWHPLHYSPVLFVIGRAGEKQYLLVDSRRAFGDKIPEPPERIILRPGMTKEATFDLRYFGLRKSSALPPPGDYTITGLYAPKAEEAGVPKEYLADADQAGVVFDRIESRPARITVGDKTDERKAAAETGWGKPLNGLRCRWLPMKEPVTAGTKPLLQVEVENVSDKPITWRCVSENTWGVKRSTTKLSWYTPKFTVLTSKGAQASIAETVRKQFGIRRDRLGNDDVFPGYYTLPPKGRLALSATFPMTLKSPGNITFDTYLDRFNNTTSVDRPFQTNAIVCPPLTITVIQSKTDGPKPLPTGEAQKEIVSRHPDEKTAVAALLKLRARVEFNKEGRVSVVDLQNRKIKDDDIKPLAKLANLRHVILHNTGVTDAALVHVRDSKSLRVLNLSSTEVTDKGLVYLRESKDLRILSLRNTKVTDNGLAHLKKLGNIKELDLGMSNVTGSGLVHLSCHKTLLWLNLGNGPQFGGVRSPLNDAGLAHLKAFTELRKLGLEATAVTDKGMQHLAGLKQLTNLSIARTKVTNSGLKPLESLTNLHTLDITSTGISDAGIEHLKALPKLRVLYLRDTHVTLESTRRLLKLYLAFEKREGTVIP